MGAAERVGEVWMDGIGRLERMVACWRAGFRMFSLEFRGAWDDVPELGYIYIYIYIFPWHGDDVDHLSPEAAKSKLTEKGAPAVGDLLDLLEKGAQ